MAMIVLCERCCAPIHSGEARVRLAQIDHVRPDGSVAWLYLFVHTTVCVAPPIGPARPDTGSWDPARRVGAQRR